MRDSALQPQIAVVIATKDRTDLLARRALCSVASQSRIPDRLVVVDDSNESSRPANRDIVARLSLNDCQVVYLENDRTPGASGSWNTALEFLLCQVDDPASLFVAGLDDDDAWAPDYLERCNAQAQTHRLDMVASDLFRIETLDGAPLMNEAPESLRADDFLIGNPGVQGSNLFVRLSVLLAAGQFDEALRSTTDRDLCIRISDMGTVRYGRLPVALVHHFAESSRPRLSARGSEDKLRGLSAFWRKHAGRMTPLQRETCRQRARKLFDWCPEASGNARDRDRRTSRAATLSRSAPDHAPYPLYVGVISSEPATLARLLRGLAALRLSPSVKRLAVVVLDNGSPARELNGVVAKARRQGLAVAIASVSRQRRDAAAGAFGERFRTRTDGQVGIAQARTMVQRYVGELLRTDSGSIGWILDDDMRVDERALAFLPWLPAFRNNGTAVLIGSSEGASPNPPLNGTRVQLVDLLHNLTWLRALPADARLPDRSPENAELRATYPDYYYDLSRKHTGHLETPYWLEPGREGGTVREAYARVLAAAPGILHGIPLTRPLIANMKRDPLSAAKDSVNRGGNTFILDSRALTSTPNTITRLRGREARRSDMIWAIVNRHYRRMEIKAVEFPVHHVGRVVGSPSLEIDKVQGELIGSALYGGVSEFLGDQPNHELEFSAVEMEQVCRLARQYMGRRLASLRQSFLRIAGLTKAIRKTVEPGELDDFLRHLDCWSTPETFAEIRAGVRAQRLEDVAGFLASLRPTADDFAAASVDVAFLQEQFGPARDRKALGTECEA